MFILAISTSACYVLLITILWIGWEKLDKFECTNDTCSTFVSIIIPLRNEESNIKILLDNLLLQNYSQNNFEIIAVDDHSEDKSTQEVLKVKNNIVKLLHLPEGITGKKKAIQFGIDNSSGDLILTCDADCHPGKNWIMSHATYYAKNNSIMLSGPVCGKYKHAFSKMQSLEMFGLLGSTAGAAAIGHHIMCNGANLSFKKEIYKEIRPIYNQSINSGDDMFILEHLKKKYRDKIHFIKSTDCIVHTFNSDSLSSFFRQRVRWAGKARHFKDADIIICGFIIFIINVLLLYSLVLGIFRSNLQGFLILFLSKLFIDILFLYRITQFFGKRRLLWYYPLVQSIYFIYVCITLSLSIFLPVSWKGRKLQ